jgi:predicted RND superfamily exporter protein
MRGIIARYSDFVVNHPFMVLLIALILTGFSFWTMALVTTTDMNYQNMLPQNHTEIKALDFVSDEFPSSGSSISIVVEIDPHYQNSSEARDVRSYEAIEYMELIENKARKLDNVVLVSGMPDALREMNGGILPRSKPEILNLTGSLEATGGEARVVDSSARTPFDGLISSDYSLAVISVKVSDLSKDDEVELISGLKNILEETERPAGLKVGLTGEIAIAREVTNLIGPTMGQTSTLSLIGILIIVSVLFMSLRKGLTSLLAILFGVIWVYGFIGVLGISLTSATSGSLSMIMGVGVDFGIQIVNRFRQEHMAMKAESAMKKTLNATILPMSITTMSALIGFRAMSLGELTLLSDLGNIMSLGILTCFLAAIMIIPPIIILSEKLKSRIMG